MVALRALGRTDYEPRGARCRRSRRRASPHAGRIWLTEHRRYIRWPRRPARAPEARQRHSDDQGRSGWTDHLSRARTARRLSALRFAEEQARGARHGPGDRSRGGRMARFHGDFRFRQAPAAPGVYTMASGGEAKIAALGLRVANGCTYHGLAVNIAMDLSPYTDIDPCGHPRPRGDAARRPRRPRPSTSPAPGSPRTRRASRASDLTMDKPVPAASNLAGVKHKGDATRPLAYSPNTPSRWCPPSD